MKVSINWIKDFVDLNGIDVDKLISKFTMSVAEVEGIEYKGRDISGVVTAKILSVEPVPNSKKLHLLKVDVGEKEPLQIVCGAPNVRVGLVTALAKIGAKLGDITISKASLAGLDSFGMCCGGDEIGISDDHSGIVELPEDTKIGVDIKSVLDIEDIVFEIDNTSLTNRPDLWGQYGIAREIAALIDRPLKPLDLQGYEDFSDKSKIDVSVTSKECFRYTSAKLSNITKKTSSLNKQIRLFYCGMRGINLLADITNYVMLELGQPMHAFDGDIVNKIEVFNLKDDAGFKTLDGTDRKLKKDSMVIATNSSVVALAGIMGGENSEITNETTSVLIESACFDAYKVRSTALGLGMRTEASARYEKSLDPELTLTALLRYVYLVKQEDGGATITSGITDIYNKHYDRLEVEITKDYIDNFIGQSIDEEEILKILTSLEFKILENNNHKYKVLVPTFRATKDINGKADLVEEITRVYGYDNITAKSIVQPVKPVTLDRNIKMEYDTKYALATRYNMNETHSYIWYDIATCNSMNVHPKSYCRIVNSINKENDKIRSTMIPSLLKVIYDNKGFYNEIGTFEIGRVVTSITEENLVDERKKLGVVLYKANADIVKSLCDAKSKLEYLLNDVLKLKFDLIPSECEIDYYLHKNYYKVVVDGEYVGDLFALDYRCTETFGDNATVVGFELDYTLLSSVKQNEVKFDKISKYPTTKLDFNFVIPQNMYYRDIIGIANNLETELNYNVSLLDVFENKDLTKSYTLHYEVNSLDRTLTSQDIDSFHSLVIETFENQGIKLKL